MAMGLLYPTYMARSTEFFKQGKCYNRPELNHMFFPVEAAMRFSAEAKAFCQGCSVIRQCLQYAVAEDIEHGVWGGLSEFERRRNRRLSLLSEANDIYLRRNKQREQERLANASPFSPVRISDSNNHNPQASDLISFRGFQEDSFGAGIGFS